MYPFALGLEDASHTHTHIHEHTGGLFAQDEMMVMEHPVLASLQLYLKVCVFVFVFGFGL